MPQLPKFKNDEEAAVWFDTYDTAVYMDSMEEVEIDLRIPKSLHNQVRELASEEGVSMNQFVMLALAEKVATLQAVGYLEERAKRGNREKLLAVLAKAPDVEPEEYDRL